MLLKLSVLKARLDCMSPTKYYQYTLAMPLVAYLAEYTVRLTQPCLAHLAYQRSGIRSHYISTTFQICHMAFHKVDEMAVFWRDD